MTRDSGRNHFMNSLFISFTSVSGTSRQAGITGILDVVEKLPYLKTLGINTIQPLPVVEFPTLFSLGYNGVDYFSPETDYGVRDTDPALNSYLASINQKLFSINPDFKPYRSAGLQGTANQLKVMIDVCHVYGLRSAS